MNAVDTDAVREFARRSYIEPARRRGDQTVRILAGEVHRALKLTNRVPLVCNALASRTFLEQNGLQLERREGPPSGQSTTVVFIYRLKSEPSTEQRTKSRSPFYALRGIGTAVFGALGGGEAFIRRERNAFAEESDQRESDNP